MKQFLKDNWFRISIILVSLFAIVIFFLLEISKEDQIKRDKENQAYKLQYCLALADNTNQRADCFKQFPQ